MHLKLMPIRIGHRPIFLCKARKYEALNAGRTVFGNSALCKMLIKVQAKGKLGYVISLSDHSIGMGLVQRLETALENLQRDQMLSQF
jgi:hypothetical protein